MNADERRTQRERRKARAARAGILRAVSDPWTETCDLCGDSFGIRDMARVGKQWLCPNCR